MKSCQFEHLLVPYMQHELTPEEKAIIANHLTSCEYCQNLYADLKNVDAILNRYEHDPIPAPIYRTYTKQLAHHFKTEPVWKTSGRVIGTIVSSLFLSQSPAFRAARAFAILIIGVFVGRYFFMPSQQHPVQTTVAESQAVLTRDDIQFISDYMVKSELLLLTIANTASDKPSDDDIFLNKDIAQTLLYKTAQVQRKAEALDDQVVISFLNHLELVLLEISNRDDEEIRNAFQDIKEMVNEAEMVQKSRRLQRRLEKELQNT